ncbi:MAG: hypothetical protein ACUZ8O_09485 [Candidatus Anammoxibacter sp.]
MWEDPIVQDVRHAGENLAKTANYNLEKFFENLRKNEKKFNLKTVSKVEFQQDTTKKAQGHPSKM